IEIPVLTVRRGIDEAGDVRAGPFFGQGAVVVGRRGKGAVAVVGEKAKAAAAVHPQLARRAGGVRGNADQAVLVGQRPAGAGRAVVVDEEEGGAGRFEHADRTQRYVDVEAVASGGRDAVGVGQGQRQRVAGADAAGREGGGALGDAVPGQGGGDLGGQRPIRT